eukprot:scaffold126249_cov66-Phaeocystis_antarctica.AAC.2
MNGCIIETNKNNILAPVHILDKAQLSPRSPVAEPGAPGLEPRRGADRAVAGGGTRELEPNRALGHCVRLKSKAARTSGCALARTETPEPE